MTRQQELELLAEWLGVKVEKYRNDLLIALNIGYRVWNPLTNDTDFLNMVAGRVKFCPDGIGVLAEYINRPDLFCLTSYEEHNNSEYIAMKHAAYQVCLIAAGEGKE